MGKTLNGLDEEAYQKGLSQMDHARDFRPFLPEPTPELNCTRKERTEEVMKAAFFADNYARWSDLLAEPFKGITTDGTLRPNARAAALEAGEGQEGSGVDIALIAQAFDALCATLRPHIYDQLRFNKDAREWRRWHNMPAVWERDGIGLEEMTETEREAMHALLRASLSAKGYQELVDLMHINRFSGDLIGRPDYLNENSYSIGLFGSPTDPYWGWQIYGHHIALNCVIVGQNYVLSPSFLAAEPTMTDADDSKGTNAFLDTETAALTLMRELPEPLRESAVLCSSILNADIPEGRRHWADSLHLGGAFQDNRVIALEGVSVREFGLNERAALMALIETFFSLLPKGPKEKRLSEIEASLDETWFCWMGGYDDWAPFYFRIQSPVLLAEFDHHQAVFLTNNEPARFHVHTLTRIPEGGDYAMDLIAQLEETQS